MNNHPTRRDVLLQGAALGAAAASSTVLSGTAFAQADELAPYRAAKINWKQVEGETITVAVIPASYFENLIALQPQFEALTGIKLRFEKVPPGQIRQKALLDLSSKTATYATHAADPMYYPLYVANKWVEPLDKYLNDATLTDKAWFDYDDIIKAWRDADSIDGKPYGIPYDGEVTVQVYRKDLYDAKGLKPADTYDELRRQRQGADRRQRTAPTAWRCAASRAPARTCTSTRRCSAASAAAGCSGNNVVVNSPEAVQALTWYVDTLTAYAPPAVRNWNWPDIADAFSQGTVATYIDAHSSAAVITNPEKSKVVGKIAYARWPKGPNGKRVTSIWNWGFPINAALTDKQKKATWLFIEWAASAETQARTSWKFAGPAKRSGINRMSLWTLARVRRGDEGRRRQLHPGRARIARAGHRRRLAPARAAVAGHRRDDGDGDPGGAGRPEEAEGSARRGAGAHRADPEGLSACRRRPAARARSSSRSAASRSRCSCPRSPCCC